MYAQRIVSHDTFEDVFNFCSHAPSQSPANPNASRHTHKPSFASRMHKICKATCSNSHSISYFKLPSANPFKLFHLQCPSIGS